MLILDENISAPQRERLRAFRVRVRHVGDALADYGTDDADLISILHRLARPTFFTHDADFWTPRLRHPAYCLVFLDVEDTEAADYIRRFLRHADFNTHTKRLGKVVRVHPDGLTVVASRHGKPQKVAWLRSL